MSLRDDRLVKRLGLQHPLIVAPMAGGPSSVNLVVASSNAGALGSVGGAYMPAAALTEFVNEVRWACAKPIGLNLFIPSRIRTVEPSAVDAAIAATASFRREFGLPVPVLSEPYEEDFDEQFEAVLALRPEVFSFVFGLLEPEYMRALHAVGVFVIGTATTSDEALELEASGCDAIVLQGFEAGGHRGIFDASADDPGIGTRDLVRSCIGRVRVPLIAAGGIMTTTDVWSYLGLGVAAVQMGTAFLAVDEAGTSEPYRAALSGSLSRDTRLTRAFSGRLARGVANPFMTAIDAVPESVLPFPAQNKFTRDIRGACVKAGRSDCLSLWSGSGRGELFTGTTAELISRLFP